MTIGIATTTPAPAPPATPPGKEIPPDSPPPSSEPPKDEVPVKREILEFDERQEVTITREWDRPVTVNRKLGSIPQDYYQPHWGFPSPGYGYYPTYENSRSCWNGNCDLGPVSVNRDVPEYDAAGKPRLERVTETLTEKTHDQKKSFFVSGALGAVLGAGAGVGLLAALGGGGAVAAGVVGLLGGAAAGAAIGYKAVDNDRIEEVWMRSNINHPTMTGYTERIRPDVWHEQRCENRFDRDGKEQRECETWSTLRGFHHDFYPDISWRKVGDYTYPTLQHTSKVNPVGAAALAAAGGAGVGALAALAVRFLF